MITDGKNHNQETRPVLIVGAGPTGMTAAMELSRLGIPVRLVDKLLAPSATSRALAVQARTLELFEQRGLTQEMLHIGNPANAASIYGRSKLLGKVHLAGIKSRYNFILLISQAETERILREQLARQEVLIERGTELISVSQTGDGPGAGVKAVLRDGNGVVEELEAAYLISAEGAHSLVRHALGLNFEGKTHHQSYSLADLYLDGDIPDDELSIFLGDHGFLGIFPMGRRHFRFIATDPEKHSKGAGEPTLEELQSIYNEDSHVPARLRDLTWSSRFTINSRMIETLRVGRIFFGGDAAHIHSPAGGQGMNTGIQDMIDLCWKLAAVWQGQAAPALLNTYDEDRLPVIRGVVKKTETATNALNSDSAIVHQLVTHIAPILLNQGFVQALSTGLISEVASNYRDSSLSSTAHANGNLRAGDRLADLDVLVPGSEPAGDSTDREAHLYELLDPSRFTLLATGLVTGEQTDSSLEQHLEPWQRMVQMQYIAPVPTQGDAKAQFHSIFGGSRSLILVRPDSYAGFVGGQDDWLALKQWLCRWFPRNDEQGAFNASSKEDYNDTTMP